MWDFFDIITTVDDKEAIVVMNHDQWTGEALLQYSSH